MTKKLTKPHFEDDIQKLEHIVTTLESGDLALEDALRHFADGVKLTQSCTKALGKAEQTVKALLQEGDEPTLTTFDTDTDTDTDAETEPV